MCQQGDRHIAKAQLKPSIHSTYISSNKKSTLFWIVEVFITSQVAIWVFTKIRAPQIIHFNRVFHHKPSIFGYPYFWKHLRPFPAIHFIMTTQTSNWCGHCRSHGLGFHTRAATKASSFGSAMTLPLGPSQAGGLGFSKTWQFPCYLLGIRSRNSHGNSQPFLVIGDEKQYFFFPLLRETPVDSLKNGQIE